MRCTAPPRPEHPAWPLLLLLLLLLLLVSCVSATSVRAQTFLPEPAERASFAIELEKPFIAKPKGFSSYSSIVEADLTFPVGAGKTLQVGAPFAVAGADGLEVADVADESGSTSLYLGNVRLSLLFDGEEGVGGVVDVTLPVATNLAGPELAELLGLLPWLNRMEKWDDQVVSARGAWLPSRALEGGGRVGLRVGGAAVAETDFDNLYVFTRLGGWGRVPVGSVELRGDLDTSYYLNGDDGFGQQFTSYATVAVRLVHSETEPEIFVRIPVDGDAREYLDLSVGVGLHF